VKDHLAGRNVSVKGKDEKEFRRDAFMDELRIVLEAEAEVVVWISDESAPFASEFFEESKALFDEGGPYAAFLKAG